MNSINERGVVSWKEGQCRIYGTIKECFHVKVMKNINGDQITRDGSVQDPAVLIERENGEKYLKLKSELSQEVGTYPNNSSATSPSSAAS